MRLIRARTSTFVLSGLDTSGTNEGNECLVADLPEETQAFIVKQHAKFRNPSLIAKDVSAEFGIELSREQIQTYHPEKGGRGRRMSKALRDLFEETRRGFVEGRDLDFPLAHPAGRLELLQRIADRAEENGNDVLARSVAEQAAKEVGGTARSRREPVEKEGGAAAFNPTQSKEWIELRTKLMLALRPFPDATAAVVAALDAKA
jgi:hypothetical protein